MPMHDAATRFALHIRGVTRRPILDVHVTDHCNLSCASCNHFAPIAEERYLDLESYERDLGLLARLDGADGYFGAVFLMGGEPLLHPEIADIVALTRRYLPTTELYVSTNGLLLAAMPPEFWRACKEAGATVLLTRYPIGLDHDGLVALAKERGVRALAQGQQPFSFRRTPLDPAGAQDPSNNFIHCPSGGYCLQLRDGRIYPCHRSAYMQALNARFATSFAHEAGDFLELADVGGVDGIDAFRRSPKPACRYCAFGEIEEIPWSRSCGSRDEWLVGAASDNKGR